MMSGNMSMLLVASMVAFGAASPYSSQSNHNSNNNNNNNPNNNNQLRYIPSSLIENEKGNWISLHPEVEFLPSDYYDKSPLENEQIAAATRQFLSYGNSDRPIRRSGSSSSSSSSPRHRYLEEGGDEEEEEEAQPASSSTREDNSQYRVQPFVEGVSDYDAYQQAWRMLGFMIDCNSISAYDQNNNNNDNDKHSNDEEDTGEGCIRYVLWAAYVDLGYEGGGIGEYQFWDPSSNSWDTSTCDYMKKVNGNSGRCAKMDCHVKNTHWSLLGFFKHKEIDEWMGQLFKHEGVCVWTADQYNFMKNAKDAWPEGCSNSGTTTSDGTYIYYDIKPKHGGGITLGLYTDTKCVKEYQSSGKSDSITLENVVGNFLVNGGGNSHSNDKNENSNNVNYETLSDALAAWDEAFSIWMQCQPCVAYDRFNYGYKVNDDSYRGSNYNSYRYGYDDDYAWTNYYSSKYGGADFDCYDDADYTNVNQCMKFMAKTTMNTATFRDLAVATAQGTLVDQPLAGYFAARSSFGMSTLGTYLFFVASILLLIYGIVKFRSARRQTAKEATSTSSWNPKEPLVFA